MADTWREHEQKRKIRLERVSQAGQIGVYSATIGAAAALKRALKRSKAGKITSAVGRLLK
jgi:hypothetical protein